MSNVHTAETNSLPVFQHCFADAWRASSRGGISALRFEEVPVPEPRRGEVTIAVRAAGVNPADYKSLSWGGPLPLVLGYEVAGVIVAIGPGTRIASGSVSLGDPVLAFRVQGGYATALTVNADDVFAKPDSLGFEEAANLLLTGTAAAEMLHLTRVRAGETLLVHGASGAVGTAVLQLAREIGARAIGTGSEAQWSSIRGFGATPVAYGPGLQARVTGLAAAGLDAAIDCVGTDEAVDVSLALVSDRSRVATSAALARAASEGFQSIGGTKASADYRDMVRSYLIQLAGTGRLTVPIARTFPMRDAVEALNLIAEGHAGGKLALRVDADGPEETR